MSDYVVYILHGCGTDYYKIGLAKNLHTRIMGVQTNCPFKIELVRKWHYPSKKEARTNEIKLQRQLKAKCCRGEWYRMSGLDVPQEIENKIGVIEEEGEGYNLPVRKIKKRICEKYLTIAGQSRLGVFDWSSIK